MDFKIPTVAPVPDVPVLVTMTVKSMLPKNFNLDVVSRYVNIGESSITSIKYRDIKRDETCLEITEPVNFLGNGVNSGRFKNQCTFVIDVRDKMINTKLFNNGQIVNVGCKKVDHAKMTIDTLLKELCNLKGSIEYVIPTSLKQCNMKKFFKDELKKDYYPLFVLLEAHEAVEATERLDLTPFEKDIEQGFAAFCENVKNPEYEKKIMYYYTICNILKWYFPKKDLLDSLAPSGAGWSIVKMVFSYTEYENNRIVGIFPAYVGDMPAAGELIISLINKTTQCGYYLDRVVLYKLLYTHPQIVKVSAHTDEYPGVTADLQTPEKIISIVFFNTGKINITAANSEAQIATAYEFICKFCVENFKDLLLTNEYICKRKEYEDNLPDIYPHGQYGDVNVYMLKKRKILSNPRNVKLLRDLGMLDYYRS